MLVNIVMVGGFVSANSNSSLQNSVTKAAITDNSNENTSEKTSGSTSKATSGTTSGNTSEKASK
jgi:hypothetical protein